MDDTKCRKPKTYFIECMIMSEKFPHEQSNIDTNISIYATVLQINKFKSE